MRSAELLKDDPSHASTASKLTFHELDGPRSQAASDCKGLLDHRGWRVGRDTRLVPPRRTLHEHIVPERLHTLGCERNPSGTSHSLGVLSKRDRMPSLVGQHSATAAAPRGAGCIGPAFSGRGTSRLVGDASTPPLLLDMRHRGHGPV